MISDSGKIGSRGVELLLKSYIPHLKVLQLCIYVFSEGGCEIGEKGLKTVGKANWIELQ